VLQARCPRTTKSARFLVEQRIRPLPGAIDDPTGSLRALPSCAGVRAREPLRRRLRGLRAPRGSHGRARGAGVAREPEGPGADLRGRPQPPRADRRRSASLLHRRRRDDGRELGAGCCAPAPSRRRRRRSRGRLIVLDRVAPRRVPREADATGRGGGRAGLETRLGLDRRRPHRQRGAGLRQGPRGGGPAGGARSQRRLGLRGRPSGALAPRSRQPPSGGAGRSARHPAAASGDEGGVGRARPSGARRPAPRGSAAGDRGHRRFGRRAAALCGPRDPGHWHGRLRTLAEQPDPGPRRAGVCHWWGSRGAAARRGVRSADGALRRARPRAAGARAQRRGGAARRAHRGRGRAAQGRGGVAGARYPRSARSKDGDHQRQRRARTGAQLPHRHAPRRRAALDRRR
jgi:hypothetical protein